MRCSARGALAAGLSILVLVAGAGAGAGAQETPAGDGTAGDAHASAVPVETLPLDDFGQPGRVVVPGIAATKTITIPASPDLVPQRLLGIATLSPDAGSATVEILDDDVRVALLTLSGTEPAPFAIALPPPVTDADATVLTVHTYLPLDASYCRGRNSVPEVRFSDLTVEVDDSSDPPTTVGTFLPRVLRTARLWVPAHGTAATTTAALRLGTGLVHRYGAMPVQVEVRTLPGDGSLPDVAYAPLARDFVIGSPDAGRGGLTVTASDGGAPLLVLPRARPDTAAAAMLDELAVVSVGDHVDVAGKEAPPPSPSRERTLLSLGLPVGAVQGTGRVETGVDLPQAAFGGMVESLHLQLHGRATPSAAGSDMQVSVLFDNELIDVEAPGSDGEFSVDRTVEIPPTGRQNHLAVVAEDRGGPGPCSPAALPIDLHLAGSSSLDADLGPSLGPGFVRFPQAALPASDVVLHDHDDGSVAAAVELVVALQRLSPLRIETKLVTVGSEHGGTVADAIRGDGPAIVAWDGGGRALRGLGLSVEPTPSSETVLSLSGDPLELDRDVPVLQAVPRSGDEVLAATAKDAEELRTLVATAVDEGGGFPALRGDVAALVAPGRLRFAQASSDALPGSTSSDSDDFPVRPFAAGALVVVVLALGLGVLLARRRAGRSTPS